MKKPVRANQKEFKMLNPSSLGPKAGAAVDVDAALKAGTLPLVPMAFMA